METRANGKTEKSGASPKRRTIVITCFTGLVSRNILSTAALDVLREDPGVKIVIVSPGGRADLLRKEFGAPNVEIAAVDARAPEGLNRFLWVMATNLLFSGTREVQRRAKLERDGNYADYVFSRLLSLLGRARLVRRGFRRLVSLAASGTGLGGVFDEFRPDFLFATDVYTPWDAEMLRIAKSRNIPAVGMVRSWDNITSKTLLTFIPDVLFVNTERVKKEAIEYGDVPAGRIVPVGIPHYDAYRQPEFRSSKRDFFAKFGFSESRPLILFTPPSDKYLRSDPVSPLILETLAEIPAQVLVRLSLVGKNDLGDFKLRPGVAIDEPSNSPDFIELYMSRDADRHLADSLYHSDVVITWASTAIIDASVMGKPVILVGFDAAPRPYGQSIRQYYDYDHQRAIIETGGVFFARNPAELKRGIRGYLQNPDADRDGRNRLVREFCGTVDGKRGRALGELLEKALHHGVNAIL